MPRDVSIMISLKDFFSKPLSKASEALEKLQKEIDDTDGKVDELNKKKAEVKIDMTKARQELKDAEKALDGTKDAADRLQKAQYNFESLQSELRMLSKDSNQAEKDLVSLKDQMDKAQNRAGGISGSAFGTLAKAIGTQMAGQVASEAANAYVSSAFGSEPGTMCSSVPCVTAGFPGRPRISRAGTNISNPSCRTGTTPIRRRCRIP